VKIDPSTPGGNAAMCAARVGDRRFLQEPRGVRYVHHFARRDEVRIGGGHRAELVPTRAVDTVPTEQRRQMFRIDALFREWTRHRSDVDEFRRLHDAITGCLEGSLVESD
jgi:hypothetical protein